MKVLELVGVSKRFGQIAAVNEVSFSVQKGQIISLLGPSGCGKTTTLRLIAGFEKPDGGRVEIGGLDVGGRRPYERNVGLLFQDYALFPHMTVAENVAYGLRHRGFDKREIPRRVGAMLDLVKLNGYEHRRPSELSGGQQQRVALARALATEPEVMLLDEPLSALDAKLRQELRIELKEILGTVGSTTIVVTHDQEEAMGLAEQILVMSEGRIVQQGTPVEVYASPINRFVAEFIGRSNWFAGDMAPAGDGLGRFLTGSGIALLVPAPATGAGRYEVCVRPERLVILRGEAASAAPPDGINHLAGEVVDVAHLGPDLHLLIALANGERLAAVEKNLGQPLEQVGEKVALRFRPEDCIVVPAATAG